MGNLGGPGEGQFGSWCDSRPPDHFQILVGEDARRDATSAELLHIITPALADGGLVFFEWSRWLKHQHTVESGFLGPSIVATSLNRVIVAGRTSMVTMPR